MGVLFIRFRYLLAACCCALLLPDSHSLVAQEIPADYPETYQEILQQADKEGAVVVYGNTENVAIAPLLQDFQKTFPKIRLDYIEIRSADLYSRVSSEVAAGALRADVIWSSAMDLNVQMVEDGLAATYPSPEKKYLPSWASWQDKVYGTTFEPMVLVYNSQLVNDDEMPRTRLDLAEFLVKNKARFKGKVAAYDPPRVGLGYLAVSQDAKQGDSFWKLVNSFGSVDINLYVSAGTMLEKISAGEHAIGYNIVGPYAYLRNEIDPNVKVVIPQDYTLIVSRSAFIAKQAPHPHAARIFLDYLLSKRGQDVIANKAHLFSVRLDVKGRATASKLIEENGNILKPIPIDGQLLEALEPMKRLAFFKKWNDALKAGKE